MSTIYHPINPHMTRKGNDLSALLALCERVTAEVNPTKIEDIVIYEYAVPHIAFNSRMTPIRIGEVGLHYLVYRLNADLDLARTLFRKGELEDLGRMLNGALRASIATGLHDRLRPLFVITLDGEFVSILQNYSAVSNKVICNRLRHEKMERWVKHWVWRPLECSIYMEATIVFDRFHYGAAIKNGETGHTALRFSSVLWTEDVLVPGAGPVIDREWITPYSEQFNNRHTSDRVVMGFLKRISATMKEDENVISLKRSSTFPGSVAVSAIDWSKIKARDSAKLKMKAAFDDALIVAGTGSCLDVIEAACTVSDHLKTKAADSIAEQMIELILDKIREL